MVTGTVAHNVSLLARYVSPVKKSESSRKELSGFLVSLLECSRVEKEHTFANLSRRDTNLTTVPVPNVVQLFQLNGEEQQTHNKHF